MAWITIIAALLTVFGPAISDWLENCTKDRLKEAADSLPAPSTFASEGAAVAAMFNKAIAALPRRAFLRRKALARMKKAAVVNGKLRTKPLTSAELKEAKAVVKGIRK